MAKLNERAMLVHLQVSSWTGAKKDRKVTQETCSRYEADGDAGSWWTYFIPPEDRKRLVTAANRLRNEAKRDTFPWLEGGLRIIPSAMYLDYAQRMRKAMQSYNDFIDKWLDERYPEIIKNMPNRLKGLLDARPMPTAKELRVKFGAYHNMFPIPDMSDFRVQMDAEIQDEVREEMEQSFQSSMNKAMMCVWQQLHDTVEKVAETLKDPDKRFHDSMIGNLIDLCIKLPKMNFTEDENLKAIRKEVIDNLCRLKPESLREDKSIRKEAAKTAKELIGKMSAYMK